jgi:hypothetical protein
MEVAQFTLSGTAAKAHYGRSRHQAVDGRGGRSNQSGGAERGEDGGYWIHGDGFYRGAPFIGRSFPKAESSRTTARFVMN